MAYIVLEVVVNLVFNPFIPAACFVIPAVVATRKRGGRRALERLVVSLVAAFLCGASTTATWYWIAALPGQFGVPVGYRGLFEDALPVGGAVVAMCGLYSWLAWCRAYSVPEFLCLPWFIGTGVSTGLYLCFGQDLVPMAYIPWMAYGTASAAIAFLVMFIAMVLLADRSGKGQVEFRRDLFI
ncbi:hypothetical protein G7Y31_11070 [Corynebacterium lizhenjunii]|uniref:Uncharacterized protein n=1 Tax=Corynebacterium lizhenjunii TaxID=2709394 RepID=A0A7T0PBV2_9CORY|nr:hypothetical protein [Corynebacterium lizhenjunii]QPK79022.1 hypothetical protein G7Y31_11070 [Corynebacterium lizhenjunii]